MKIVATLKSRNEERNIERAIRSYHDWVDLILLADGGSEDKTIEIASNYSKVKIRNFQERYYREDGTWRNHEGKHLNFLFKWAENEDADWIVHDDCDCVMNKTFHDKARKTLEESQDEIVCACRLYVYGTDQHFLKMSYINNKWQTGLWAWKASTRIRCQDVERHFTLDRDIELFSRTDVWPPNCILHYFAPDEDTIQQKILDYKKEQPHAVHPRKVYGEPEPLPEWALP